MRRISPITRGFLFSFLPACLVLLMSMVAMCTIGPRIIKRQLGAALHEWGGLLSRVHMGYLHQHSVLAAKPDSTGLEAAVGMLAEASQNPAMMEQARRTVEMRLYELQKSSVYEFLAVTDLKGRTVAAITSPGSARLDPLPGLPSHPGLAEIQRVLYQLEFAPINCGGKPAAVLIVGNTLDLGRLPAGEDAILLQGNRVVRSTFPRGSDAAVEQQLRIHCGVSKSDCEISVAGKKYIVSVLESADLGAGYRLLRFRPLNSPSRGSSESTPVPTMADTGYSSWTTHPGASASISDTPVGIAITENDYGADNLNASCKIAPAPPYTLTGKFTLVQEWQEGDSYGGFAWRDSTSGKLIPYGLLAAINTTPHRPTVYAINFTDPVTYAGSASANATTWSPTAWIQMSDDGFNATWRYSLDGFNYLTVATIAKSSSFLGETGFNQVCIFLSAHGSNAALSMQSYSESSPWLTP